MKFANDQAESWTGWQNLQGNAAGDIVPFRLDDFAGLATFRGKPIYNQQQIINQIDGGVSQSTNGKITYTFLTGPTTTGWYNSPKYQEFGVTESFGYSEMSEAEKAVARESMILWDDLI